MLVLYPSVLLTREDSPSVIEQVGAFGLMYKLYIIMCIWWCIYWLHEQVWFW